MNFIEIQSWPQIPSIGYFVSLFSSSFNLPDFDIEDLEEALLLDSSENNSIDDPSAGELSPRLIPELIVSLLRGCDLVKSWPNITTSNYQMFLRRLFRHKCEEYNTENPFNTDTDFHSLSLRTKVVILNYLCDFRLDSADVEAITNSFEADSLRIEPLGHDSNGSIYWYFFGTRLYREDPRKANKKGERVWQVICFTEQDWETLANKFKHSKSRKESALYTILTEDFLPNIPVLFKAKEAERRRRLFQRRSSKRVKGLAERQKDKKFTDDNLPLLTETYAEKYLEEKKKQVVANSKIRQKIQEERAQRAQRRSSSLSSTTSSKSSCGRKSSFNTSFDNIVEEDYYSLSENAFSENKNLCLSNKENILHSNLDVIKSNHNRTSSMTKMPPTSTKLPGRQTNNSLSSITGQIVIQPPATNSPGPSTSRKKKAKTEVILTTANLVSPLSFMETDEVLQIGMHKVLQHVKNHDDAWPFMDPVEEDIAPRYYSIIKRPMDLLKMEEKLDSGEYRSFTEFRTDFKLIVNNCRLYNGQSNEYTEMVNNLQNAFDRSTKKYFDQTSSDEEPVLLEYPPIEGATNRLSTSKENEFKKEKNKTKDKKHIKQSVKENSSEDDEKVDEKVSQKKIEKTKSKSLEEPSKKLDKKASRVNICDKKKEKSTKGVKRKHKDKDKSDKPKTKKMKKDNSEEDNKDFEFASETNESESEDEKIPKDSNKKVKNGKTFEKTLETPKEPNKSSKKSKKSEIVKQSSGKRKEHKVTEPEPKKTKKDPSPKVEKFSKTNEKANNKKRKLEQSIDDRSDSDSGSVHDLIEEKKSPVNNKKVEMKKPKSKDKEKDKDKDKDKAVKETEVREISKKPKELSVTPKKLPKKSSTPKSITKKKSSKKSSKDDDLRSVSSASFSRSPSPLPSINSSAITDDFNNSFDNEGSKSSKKLDSSFRSDTPEIKDKFDLIKERRNKMNQEKEKEKKKSHHQSASQAKEKNHKLKETIEKLKIKNEKSKSQIEFVDEVLGGKTVKKEVSNVFDKLKNEGADSKGKKESSKKKADVSSHSEIQVKSKKPKHEKTQEKLSSSKSKAPETKSVATANNSNQNNKSKKQNKACLDVLDMETEQTLKDINKWLEHTPRFEYSSASNSPSRYIIDEIDMPSKMDDNDFRKPIPLMPSSPSASHANFQSPQNTPKDFNLLKESNNNKQAAASQNAAVASTSNKKVGSKEPKRKSLKEKLQQLPRKKEVQRTIDRLQPGKTKGNLLHNIQNINKPEEFFPLGNREKVKEVKNSLIVQTDESSPKLSLGTVLDTQAFNFNDSESKKPDNECFDEPSLKVEDDKDDNLDDDENVKKEDESGNVVSNEIKKESGEIAKEIDGKNNAPDSKPNLNAWFKAFGAPKKPKKSESQDESGKLSDNNDSKIESNYIPTPHRRLSTGSSVSERSSVEDSPQVGLEERLGAPAPYPSPIGASPIMASPKTDEAQKASSSSYPANGSTRVGFYQDMTSSKSSPEKSCSPREMPSPYGQYSQQHLYSAASASTGANMYGNFYNPENSSASKQSQQASYSKPITSPASYYDQYKQPLSHESDFNNSMSPSTNPNSPYHSQQSSPYQQQPNSPFQSPASGANGSSNGNNATNISQAPNSPYSQPNSPYQQNTQVPFVQSPAEPQKPPPQNQPPAFPNQSPAFAQLGQNSPFNQFNHTPDQLASAIASHPKPSEWNNKPNNNIAGSYNLNTQQTSNNFNVAPQPQSLHQTQNIPQNSANIPQHHQTQQHTLKADGSFSQSQVGYNKNSSNDPQSSGTPLTTPLYGTSKLPVMANAGYSGIDMVTKNTGNTNKDESTVTSKQIESSKYLDLSKQQAVQMNQHQPNQYQQMFDHSNYKPPLEFDVSKGEPVDMFNRSIRKNNTPMSTPCVTPGFWGNVNSNKQAESLATYGANQNESSKTDLAGKSAINSILNPPGNSFLNNTVSHQQPSRGAQPAAMDINYKQPPLFNNPAASSMMDLTAFMRDFRQAEERFSSLSGAGSSFYDKSITPAHMFGKNLPQTNSSAALQQMFNSSMTTMAYNREQQNMTLASYHNRLNASQGPPPTSNQPHVALPPQQVESKAKKPRKKKNNAAEESVNNNAQVQNQSHQQHHQSQSHQHSQHQQLQQHQQIAHQQSFQSYSGLKVPGATDPSAISLKSVVPGSAFNYGPTPLGMYGENPAYLDEFRGTPNPYYPPPPGLGHRSTPDPALDKASTNPPPAHPQAPSSPYHHLLPPHHPSRSSYPFMDPAALQQQYRMMLNQSYQAGYHPALGMHNQPPHWPPHHM